MTAQGLQHLLCRFYKRCSIVGMEHTDLDPFAEHLLTAFGDVAAYSRQFTDDQGVPPTSMAKVHHLRSVVQARLTQDERYELRSSYAEFGRVQCLDHQTEVEFVVRSASAVRIETGKSAHGTGELFDGGPFKVNSPVRLLIIEFTKEGLRLSQASAVRAEGRGRLDLSGEVQFLGLWPYTAAGPEGSPFDQGSRDAFGEVGDLDIDGEDEGEAR
jgi:hypothetical protein